MKISIITVCFNSEKYIEQAILSVISQTYTNIEYIAIDGGSTDGTMDVLNKYNKYFTHCISESDKNMYDAINKGMRLSTGDFIGILNSDDFYLSKYVIESVVERLTIMPSLYEGVYGNLCKFTSDNIFIKRKKAISTNYKTLLCSRKLTFVGHGTLFISREAYDKVGDYAYLEYRAAADYDYVLRLFRCFKFKYINIDIMGFRVHEESITSSGVIDLERIAVLKKNGYEKEPYIYRWGRYCVSWMYYALINARNMNYSNLKSFLSTK